MSRVPKKADFMTVSIYSVLAAFVIYFSAALGACFDLSLDEQGKFDFENFANSLETVLADTNLVFSMLKEKGNALVFPVYTAFALGLYVLMKVTSKKKFHRKGEEHGSARWANKKEINSLLDKPTKQKKSFFKARDRPEKTDNSDKINSEISKENSEKNMDNPAENVSENINNKSETAKIILSKKTVCKCFTIC
ncbi:MAG: hypothetical protein NC078_09340 [Ruminococcus sp.]|nr:hypothetical protein [Ruminococcus sp.]